MAVSMKFRGFSNLQEIFHFTAVGLVCFSNGIAAGTCDRECILYGTLTAHSICGAFIFVFMALTVCRRIFFPGEPDNIFDKRCDQIKQVMLVLYSGFTLGFIFFLIMADKTGFGTTPCRKYSLAMLIISALFIFGNFIYSIFLCIRHYTTNNPNTKSDQPSGQHLNWANQGVSVTVVQQGIAGTPLHQGISVPPPQEGTFGPWPQYGIAGPPVHQGIAGPPPQYGIAGPPLQQGIPGPPPQYGIAGRPLQQGIAGPPPQQGITGPPPQHGIAGPPLQQEIAEPPPQQEIAGPSPQQGTAGPSPHQGMAGPSLQQGIAEPQPLPQQSKSAEVPMSGTPRIPADP